MNRHTVWLRCHFVPNVQLEAIAQMFRCIVGYGLWGRHVGSAVVWFGGTEGIGNLHVRLMNGWRFPEMGVRRYPHTRPNRIGCSFTNHPFSWGSPIHGKPHMIWLVLGHPKVSSRASFSCRMDLMISWSLAASKLGWGLGENTPYDETGVSPMYGLWHNTCFLESWPGLWDDSWDTFWIVRRTWSSQFMDGGGSIQWNLKGIMEYILNKQKKNILQHIVTDFVYFCAICFSILCWNSPNTSKIIQIHHMLTKNKLPTSSQIHREAEGAMSLDLRIETKHRWAIPQSAPAGPVSRETPLGQFQIKPKRYPNHIFGKHHLFLWRRSRDIVFFLFDLWQPWNKANQWIEEFYVKTKAQSYSNWQDTQLLDKSK